MNFIECPERSGVRCSICCTPVPTLMDEVEKIKAYVVANNISPNLKNTEKNLCIWVGKFGGCMIYPVRPLGCRIFGCNYDYEFGTQSPELEKDILEKCVFMQSIKGNTRAKSFTVLPNGWWSDEKNRKP